MKFLTRSAAAGVSEMAMFAIYPSASAVECCAQCIFDDQEPAEFLGRNFKLLRPVGGRSGQPGIQACAFEELTNPSSHGHSMGASVHTETGAFHNPVGNSQLEKDLG